MAGEVDPVSIVDDMANAVDSIVVDVVDEVAIDNVAVS